MANNLYRRMSKIIGGLINKSRTSKDFSFRKLASETNLSIALLSSVENGDKVPRLETLLKIMKALDIPMSEVFSNSIIPTEETDNSNSLDNILYSKGLSKEDVSFINEYIRFKTDNFVTLGAGLIPCSTLSKEV